MFPSGVAVDDDGNLFVADLAAAAILQMDSTGSESEVMVQEYESKPFAGPTDVVFDDRRNMFFTDSGPFGESTLSSPRGSLFAVVESPDGGQVLKPIALESLAHPAGLCLSPDGACMYVIPSTRARNRGRVGGCIGSSGRFPMRTFGPTRFHCVEKPPQIFFPLSFLRHTSI